MRSKYSLIVILGPTASGKTAVAANLAAQLNTEVISADSRQVYRDLNLGTGKDYDDYIVEGKPISCHLIDVVAPGTQYNVYEYQKDFFKVYKELSQKGIVPVLCGGTGMYLEAVLEGYKLIQVPVNEELRNELDEKSLEELIEILKQLKQVHATSDIENKKRAIRAIEIEKYYLDHKREYVEYPEITPLIVGVRYDRETERKRITRRLEQRLNQGMVKEVEQLLAKGLTPEQLIYYGLEYKYLTLYCIGELSYDAMFAQLNTAIHQFAKRQMTWFRRMERKGYDIHWLDGFMPLDEKINKIKDWLK